MDIRVRNNHSGTKIWGGKEFQPSEVYQLQQADYVSFVTDLVLFGDVSAGNASIGDLSVWYSNAIDGWEYLSHQKENEVKVTAIPDPSPFAQPTYRTKRNATAAIVEVSPNDSEIIDFPLTAERYASGGSMVVQNAELGDYISAEVYDKDSVIPEAYRSATCENWPTVAKYVDKEFVAVLFPGSIQAGACTHHILDTRPLNAKISQGLYLRVTYNAVDAGTTRKVVINYDLSKKL